MSTITFDTHKFVKDLRDAGMPEPQAEAFVRAQQEILSQALDTALATKADIAALRLDMAGMHTEIVSVRGEMSTLKWMMGALIALSIANFAKQFF
ncbi:MAG: CCDC90 family protein [Sulfuricellaceae bacterium]|nr:CCDC90 family protein [Sulfuricellaceae bacterium]